MFSAFDLPVPRSADVRRHLAGATRGALTRIKNQVLLSVGPASGSPLVASFVRAEDADLFARAHEWIEALAAACERLTRELEAERERRREREAAMKRERDALSQRMHQLHASLWHVVVATHCDEKAGKLNADARAALVLAEALLTEQWVPEAM